VEEALLGARVGEERKMDVEYPPSYVDKKLAEKKVEYRFQVKKILVKELPKLDDEFAKDVGPYENLEALKERLKDQIHKEKKTRARNRLEEELLDEILKRNSLDAPRSLVEARHAQMMKDAKVHFLSRGLQLEQSSEDYQRMEADLEELSEKEVKKHLLVEAIAQKESIEVSDDDVEARIQEIAAEHEQSVEKIKADIQKPEDGMERFKTNLLRRKTLDFLLLQAKIVDKGKKG
jgi:trigger factor